MEYGAQIVYYDVVDFVFCSFMLFLFHFLGINSMSSHFMRHKKHTVKCGNHLVLWNKQTCRSQNNFESSFIKDIMHISLDQANCLQLTFYYTSAVNHTHVNMRNCHIMHLSITVRYVARKFGGPWGPEFYSQALERFCLVVVVMCLFFFTFFLKKTLYLLWHFAIPFGMLIHLVNLSYCTICDYIETKIQT